MMKLRDLIEEYSANAAIFADRGNGSAKGELGICVKIDEAMLDEYGDVNMYKLDSPHVSEDGYTCEWASDWFDSGQIEERIFF
ncbi:MAG: hypothetical protein D6732_20125 [Methanobacteriota archaeon]|nr:MAG: hypothetical protein D6732_20125 [Euryarchaeota archaeon]